MQRVICFFKIVILLSAALSLSSCKLDTTITPTESADAGSEDPAPEVTNLTITQTTNNDVINSTNHNAFVVSGECSNLEQVRYTLGGVDHDTSCSNNAWSVSIDFSNTFLETITLTFSGIKASAVLTTVDRTFTKLFDPTEIVTLAGQASAGSADGVGSAASFTLLAGFASDGTYIYACDRSTHTIRRLNVTTNMVDTIAGVSGVTGTNNGAAATATFNQPNAIVYQSGYLYVADTNNHLIRRIHLATMQVETYAGSGVSGSLNGIGTAARFNRPHGLTSDGTFLWIADTANRIIRKINLSDAEVTTVAGTAGVVCTTDGKGAAASFNWPNAIVEVGDSVYVQENFRHSIRKIVKTTGVVTTYAGTSNSLGTQDGIGTAARFNRPTGIATDGNNLYVVDAANVTIRKISLANAQVTTIAGTVGVGGYTDGPALSATLNWLLGAFYHSNRLYITSTTYLRVLQ